MLNVLWENAESGNLYQVIAWRALATCASLPFFLAIYNLLFHPLRHYPGPWYAAASRLWYVSKALGGYHKYAIHDLHERYGQIVRIAPDEISYIHPDAWNDIYGRSAHQMGHSRVEKNADFFAAAFGSADIIVDADSESFGDQKKNAMRGFSAKSLTSRSDVISSYVKDIVQRLNLHAKEHQGPVNIEAFIGNSVLDIHARLTIGHDFDAIKRGPTLHSLSRLIHRTVVVLQHLVLLQYVPKILKSIPSVLGSSTNLFAVFGGLEPIGPAISQRVDGNVDAQESDFVSFMENTEDSEAIGKSEIKKNAFVFIISGAESLPGFICSSLYYLLQNPIYYAQASTELRDRFKNVDEITVTSAQDVPLLRAIIQETLRVSPPVVGTMPRRIVGGESEICGRSVAEGTTVGIHNYSMAHYSPYWKDVEHFRPQRWLGDSEFVDDNRGAFRPFGHGPRMCIARHLVVFEAGLILAHLLFSFDMELRPSPDWPIHKGHFVATRGPMFVDVAERPSA